jgi:hypothetical protein
MNSSVFIVTTYLSQPHHQSTLKQCINRIQLFHPDSDIIILNDSHSVSISINQSDHLKIIHTKYPKCGEINAYVWACENKDKYEKFHYIHDSTFLINRFSFDLSSIHFRPFWYSSVNIHEDTTSAEIDSIIHKFLLKDKDIHVRTHRLQLGYGSIVFGGMAIFDRVFLEFLINKTNLLSLAPLFNTRKLRCFFERLLYIILSEFYDITSYTSYSICGDILNHEMVFCSSVFLNSSISKNPYLVKIWQGR